MLPFSFHGAQQGFEREPAADEQEEKPDFMRASGGGAGRESVGVAAGASPVKSRLRHHTGQNWALLGKKRFLPNFSA